MPTKAQTNLEIILLAIERSRQDATSVAREVAVDLLEYKKETNDRFIHVAQAIDLVGTDVKSLLESRTFVRGIKKAIAVGFTGGVTLLGVIIAVATYWRH